MRLLADTGVLTWLCMYVHVYVQSVHRYVGDGAVARVVDLHLCTKAPQTPQTRSHDCPGSLTARRGMLAGIVLVMVKL